MLQTYLIRATRSVPCRSRFLQTTPTLLNAKTSGGQDPAVSQGHTSLNSNKSPQDVQSQAVHSGKLARGSSNPLDAASANKSGQASRTTSGNSEGIGFAEQVGGQSAQDPKRKDAEHTKGGEEEASPPGWFAAAKSKLGLGTTAGEVKQNRGGGEGVTGSGTGYRQVGKEQTRGFQTGAVRGYAAQTSNAEVEGSKKPKDDTHLEQSPHLTHGKDSGKGNAAEDPELPSHRGSSSAATGHSAESYFKDVDETPPPDSKTHQVAYGDTVQRASEPPSGKWKQAGVGSAEYENVSSEQPYNPPEPGAKLRYGARDQWKDEPGKGANGTAKPEEGPEGASAGGRKPEGRHSREGM